MARTRRPTRRTTPRRGSRPTASGGGDRGVRIQKFLSRAGIASRRGSEELMAQGRVRVNGDVVTTPGTRVRPAVDRVEVDGREVVQAAFRWVLLHKAAGTVTTADDPQGRPTVYDTLPEELQGLFHVGRLDLDTEGLLLFSNEGDVVHGLLHPSFEVEREYHAGVEGVPGDAALARLRDGVELDDGPARADEAERLRPEGRHGVVRLVLTEGRKREVRRLLDAVGHPVRWLRRVRFGPIELGALPAGEWRDLTETEILAIRQRVGEADSGRGQDDNANLDEDEESWN